MLSKEKLEEAAAQLIPYQQAIEYITIRNAALIWKCSATAAGNRLKRMVLFGQAERVKTVTGWHFRILRKDERR